MLFFLFRANLSILKNIPFLLRSRKEENFKLLECLYEAELNKGKIKINKSLIFVFGRSHFYLIGSLRSLNIHLSQPDWFKVECNDRRHRRKQQDWDRSSFRVPFPFGLKCWGAKPPCPISLQGTRNEATFPGTDRKTDSVIL
ncbi:hypothetical protein AMECASPLE_027967 [Ameca splendens]|uniref:Uncharacterized protein n=1 Tax=Ameca splendens TaxID=208324 RepID=A0ABV0ZE73_9TELE